VFARSARVLVVFALVVAIILHAATVVLLSVDASFVSSNIMSAADRRLLLLVTLGAFAAAFAMGALVAMGDRERVISALDRVARLLCPALLLPLFLALLHHDFGTDVEEALLLAVFVLGLDALMRVSLQAWDEWPKVSQAPGPVRRALTGFFDRPRLVFAVVIAIAVAHGIFMGTWAVWSHHRFSTFGFDLGQYDQVFQSTLHGRWMAIPTLTGNPENWGDFSSHADLATFYLLPLYALYPHAETLLVLQAALLAMVGVPLYLLASNHLPRWIALVIVLAWVLYAPLHGAQLYDVHMQPFGAAWAICAMAAIDRKKFRLYWVFFTLAILCREDVSIGLACLGLLMTLSGQRVRTGIATMAIATFYFFLMRFVVMQSTSFAAMFKDLFPPGAPQTFGSVIQTLISNPAFVGKTLMSWEKARYVAQIFAPIAFLPLRRPALWLLGIPAFILTLLSTQYMPTISIAFQYVANWAAYMFPASVISLAMYGTTPEGRRKQSAAAVAMLFASIVASMQWGAYSTHLSVRAGFVDIPFARPSTADVAREAAVQALMKKVPEGMKLCSSDRVQPHTTQHLDNYSLKYGAEGCDYLIWTDVGFDFGAEQAAQALSLKTIEVVGQKAGVTLAKKKQPPAPPPVVPIPVLPAPAPAH
jgi:uncharacterized membrane protein